MQGDSDIPSRFVELVEATDERQDGLGCVLLEQSRELLDRLPGGGDVSEGRKAGAACSYGDVYVLEYPRYSRSASLSLDPYRFLSRENSMRTMLLLLSLVVVFDLLVPRPALAYVDPGSGSFVIQMIVAAVMGAGVTLKLYWHKIKDRLSGSNSQEDDPDFDD